MLDFITDEKLAAAANALTRMKNCNSVSFRERLAAIHIVQKKLLQAIYRIYDELPEHVRSSRSYRESLPEEDSQELENAFSENIFFAAEALYHGFRIRGIEYFTDELAPPARELYAAFEAVRFVLRTAALTNPEPPHSRQVHRVLLDFDFAWTAFEKTICDCYFAVTLGQTSLSQLSSFSEAPRRLASSEIDYLAVLFSETILRATATKLLQWDDIYACEPRAIIAIPRLAIVAGLVHMPDYRSVLMPSESSGFRWFTRSGIRRILSELAVLSASEILYLEHMLVETSSVRPSLDAPRSSHLRELSISSEKRAFIKRVYAHVCSVADRLASGSRANDLLKILKNAFTMHLSS